ncbi:hypothetical protein OAB59_00550 [Pelagibacteraceae bacterium]|nr:hypothetical protein [Pelagibacteraceae bacterium]
MLKKVLSCIVLLHKVKFKRKLPQGIELIVIDGEVFHFLEEVASKYNYKVLETRTLRIKEIYINLNIIKYVLKNFFKTLKISYLAAVIEEIKPRIIITFIDNSTYFSELAKKLYKKYTFIAVQNACRIDILENEYYFKKDIIKKNPNTDFFIPNFFCLGQNDIDSYKKLSIKVDHFFIIGSLRINKLIKKIKIKRDKKYDICFISNTTWTGEKVGKEKSFETGYTDLLLHTIKFCIEKNTKFIFCLKAHDGIESQYKELNYLKKILTEKYFNYLKENCTLNDFEENSTYKNVLQSDVIIGKTSTILGESLALKKKIFVCNFSNLQFLDFPIQGICALKENEYRIFEKNLKKILEINFEQYLTLIENSKNYLVYYEDGYNPNNKLIEFIDKNLNLKARTIN